MKLKECNIGQIVVSNSNGIGIKRIGHIVGLTYRYSFNTIVNSKDLTHDSLQDEIIPVVLFCGETIPIGVSAENLSKLS